MKIYLKAAAAACALAFASPASAAVFDWTITSSAYDGSGQLTTDDTPLSAVALLVTSFEGNLNGWNVSLVAPDVYGNDNALFPAGAIFPDIGQTSSLVSHQGIAFSANGLLWRLASDSQPPHATTLTSICCFSQVTFSIEPADSLPIPEPATWAMMVVGFGAVGYSMRLRRRTEGRTRLA